MNKPLFISRERSGVSGPDRPLRPIRTMLVDDSLVVRSILERILSEIPEIEIVASCARASDALAYLDAEQVDVIVLDIEMPGISGMTALPDLLRKSAGARILILSSNCDYGGPAALEALSLGAADTLAKPDRSSFTEQFDRVLIDRIIGLANDPKPRPSPGTAKRPGSYSNDREGITKRPARAPKCIAIASSTGGIGALNTVLMALDDRVSAPILLTQHLPPAFIPFFASQLAKVTGRTVVVAGDGMRLEQLTIYVAPGDAHINVAATADGAGRIVLSTAPVASGCRPSADPMLLTLGEVFGDAGIAIVLSGMGRDGSEGARSVHANGGAIVAQTHRSCVVWGMPGAIVNAGLASAILDPADAAAYVNHAARENDK